MPLRRLALTSAAALTLATGLAACGSSNEDVHHGASEGVYVSTGGLQYQVQISRQLNAADPEDQAFLIGVPTLEKRLATGQEWFGVFLRAFNNGDLSQQASSSFYITDTAGHRYEPTAIDQHINHSTFRSWVLKPGDQLPVPGSPGRENTAQGGIVLFKLPVSAYATRPLELHIEPPSGGREATVSLDV